jgi:protein-tyrosine phosphatase
VVLDENRGRNLLVVCAANVCRSPLAEYLLTRGMRSIPEFEAHSASSAGAGALVGAAICPRVDARIWAVAPDGADFARAHVARQLDADRIAGSALILTASKAERAAVARIDPSARPRTFTLREAVALADAEVAVRPEVETDAVDVLDRFAATLNLRRGLTPPAARAARSSFARWFGRPATGDPLDVVDGHLLGDRQHDIALDEVASAVDRLLAAFRRFAS